MTDFLKWFLSFVKNLVLLVFRFLSPDGFSFGYMLLGIAVVGVVIASTVGMVALVSNYLSRR